MIEIANRWAKLPNVQSKEYPSFKQWRDFSASMMVPDKGFTKQLHALDPELNVVWDWGSEKWEIWRFPKNGAPSHHVMTIQTQNRSYRELGTDILLKLQIGNTHRFSKTELFRYFDEMDAQLRRRKRKEMTDIIQDITKETLNYQLGVLQVQVPQNIRVRRAITSAD